MISGLSTSSKKIVQVDKRDFIQDITPATYYVDFKSLELGEVFDSSDISLSQISDNTLYRKSDKEIIFTISADGSEHSQNCIELVAKEFLPLINTKENLNFGILGKMLVVYVYFSSKDKEFNYSNAKEHVINKFAELLGYHKTYACFYAEDRWSKKHAVQQVCNHSTFNKSNYLFVGYFGIKGPKGENKELSKGVDFLLGNSTNPVVILKEKTTREFQKSKGFTWLIILEKHNVNRIKTLDAFSNLIDKERDTVFGIGFFELSIPTIDSVKNEFTNHCQLFGFKNYLYEPMSFKNNISDIISEKVNFSGEIFNFVCFYNHMHKHLTNPDSNDYTNLVRKCSSNVAFINI